MINCKYFCNKEKYIVIIKIKINKLQWYGNYININKLNAKS